MLSQSPLCFSESCSTAESLTVIPERCILECLQVLYDNQFCSFCENDAAYSMFDLVEYNKALVDKRKLKWCTCKFLKGNQVENEIFHLRLARTCYTNSCFSACENGQLQINSDHKELRKQIANFFNALEASWCNDALQLNEFKDEKEHSRTKRYNPGIGGSHYRPQNSSTHSINYTQRGIVVGMIIFGIVLLCALAYLCKRFTKFVDPQQSYEINS